MAINRRSFLKRLGLLAVVPFVPMTVFKDLMPNPNVPFKCYRSNAETLGELIHQIRSSQKRKLMKPYWPPTWKPGEGQFDTVISLKLEFWVNIFAEIKPQGRFVNLPLEQKGFPNFYVSGVPILKRS